MQVFEDLNKRIAAINSMTNSSRKDQHRASAGPERLTFVPILVGPTAVGKTSVSIELARRLSAEIISADSRQVYKHLNIGTATPTDEQLDAVPHHFVNELAITEPFTAGRFAGEARIRIREIFERKRTPLVVGGAGLYIKALTEGLFDEPSRDDTVREALYRQVEQQGVEAVYERFRRLDPEYAGEVHPNDVKKIVRALEIYEVTGETPSRHYQNTHAELPFDYDIIGLRRNRKALYRRINQRVDDMFASGLVEEVRAILDRGFTGQENALQTVGYQEVIQYLQGTLSPEEAREQIQTHSRHYAKRQLTWFRNQHETTWFDFEKYASEDDLIQAILSYLTGKSTESHTEEY